MIMAKKKEVIKEEVKDPDRMFSFQDAEKIRRFWKVATATRADMDEIYHFYKKYVKPNARPYITNCKCGTSISAYYQNLMKWFSENATKFETE